MVVQPTLARGHKTDGSLEEKSATRETFPQDVPGPRASAGVGRACTPVRRLPRFALVLALGKAQLLCHTENRAIHLLTHCFRTKISFGTQGSPIAAQGPLFHKVALLV